MGSSASRPPAGETRRAPGAWRGHRARRARRGRGDPSRPAPSPQLALPRRPELGLLHRVVRTHLETFLLAAAARGGAGGRGVPRFVERELRAFLGCGVAAHGFMRVRCAACAHDRLVPFSCKRRGFCPSCGGRRMAQQAAHLVDRVLPHVPVRQWVVSLPFELRFPLAHDHRVLAHDHRLLTEVLATCLRAVLGYQRARARRLLGVLGRCGSVTAVQRFGGALNLNVHFHVIVLDGVHVEEEHDGRVSFQALPKLRPIEVAEVAEIVSSRVRSLLLRRGLLAESEDGDVAPPTASTGPMGPRAGDDHDESGGDEESDAVLAACRAASVRGTSAVAQRDGRSVRRVRLPSGPAAGRETDRGTGGAVGASSSSARAGGFDLHVGARVAARERRRLERLCRYVLRPPLAQGRLSEGPGGLLQYELARPWRDGTRAVLLEPLELLERLVSLVPAPRRNLLRYHGTLAPNGRWRTRIVPAAQPGICSPEPSGSGAGDGAVETARACCQAERSGGGRERCRSDRGVPEWGSPSGWIPWAELLRRVFSEDVLSCPRCSGRMKVIAAVTSPEGARRILEHLGLPPRAPPLAPARLSSDDWEG